jgi:hypothetical protein
VAAPASSFALMRAVPSSPQRIVPSLSIAVLPHTARAHVLEEGVRT